jgi:hypothetical protein
VYSLSFGVQKTMMWEESKPYDEESMAFDFIRCAMSFFRSTSRPSHMFFGECFSVHTAHRTSVQPILVFKQMGPAQRHETYNIRKTLSAHDPGEIVFFGNNNLLLADEESNKRLRGEFIYPDLSTTAAGKA